ncbi:hypothetical protein D3C87_1931570 [compost metagenome]
MMIVSARPRTVFMSMPISPGICTPYSAPRRATWAARALATRVFVGMQPALTQVPPRNLRSISATFMPFSAMRAARNGPAWPAPMKIASKVFIRPLPR